MIAILRYVYNMCGMLDNRHISDKLSVINVIFVICQIIVICQISVMRTLCDQSKLMRRRYVCGFFLNVAVFPLYPTVYHCNVTLTVTLTVTPLNGEYYTKMELT